MKFRNTHLALCIMITPVIIYFIIFNYVPMIGLVIAFKNYVLSDGIFGSEWVGLANFQRLFDSPDFPKAIRNTLTISLLRLFFGFAAPIILALLLNELRLALYKRVIQTVSYLPHFFSWVILGGIFIMMLSGNGPINHIVKLIKGSAIPFLSEDYWFITILVVTGIWQSVGWGAIIYLAALSGINPDMYEAAMVDGAGRWKQVWHITIPSLMPTIITLFILSLGGILTAGFDQIYNLYNPMVYDVSDIIDTYVLRRMMDMDLGLATAAGMFKSVVGLILIVGANSIAKKMSGGEQGVW